MMDSRVKEMWAAALESGEFEQGKGRLLGIGEDGKKTWCCLGVLCELHRREVGGDWSMSSVGGAYLENSAFLPHSVMAWAGLDCENQTTLINCNDGFLLDQEDDMSFTRLTFPEMAQKIREEL
jgi:hypothetical protein